MNANMHGFPQGPDAFLSSALVPIERKKIYADTASIIFRKGFVYDAYVLTGSGFNMSIAGKILMRLSVDGGGTFASGASDYHNMSLDAAANAMRLVGDATNDVSNLTIRDALFYAFLSGMNRVSPYAKKCMSMATGDNASTGFNSWQTFRGNSTALNGKVGAIQILPSTGNIRPASSLENVAYFTLYGIRFLELAQEAP